MTDNKNTNNELNDEELDTVNGGFAGGLNLTVNNMQSTKANPDLTDMTNQKTIITIQETKKDLDNLNGNPGPFGKGKNLNKFGAKFGLGKMFGRNQTKLDD